MTPELERIGKVLVEAEGGHWHNNGRVLGGVCVCDICPKEELKTTAHNPNFSKWENFGRLLKIAERQRVTIKIVSTPLMQYGMTLEVGNAPWKPNINIDQIPTLVATELCRIIEEEK